MNNRLAIYILSVVAIALGVVSCGRTGISKSVVMADSLSQSDPAAAMAFIDSITARNENMSTDSRMRLGLLRTKAQNSAGVMFTSDSVMRNIVEYYESEGDADDCMLAYYLMGSVYRDLGDSPLALQYFNKAAEQADTTSADCDYRLLCRIHGQAANLFLKQEIPYYALKEFAIAERYAMTAGDTLSALVFHEQRANAYYLLNMPDSVKAVSEHVAALYSQYGYSAHAALAVGALVHQMLRCENYSAAKEYMDIYDRYVFAGGKDKMAEEGRDVYYSYKGGYYLGINKTDSAEYFFRKGLSCSSSFSNTESACRGLAALYKQLNQADSLVKYTEMARVANDSAYASMTTEKLLHMKTLYDYGQQQRIASDERERADNALLAIVLIVASFVVILLVFFVFYYRKLLFKEKENERMQKEWHEMELENRKHRENIRMLKQTKEDLNVLLRQYEGEIEQLVKEKTAAVEDLQRKISEYDKNSQERYRKKKNVELYNSSIVIRFHYFAEKVMASPAFDDWKELYKFVSKELPELAEYKDTLKNGEYEICVLVRLGFAPSEIGILTGRKLSDIANIRKRLLLKLSNREGSAKDFDVYMKEEF